MYMYVHYFNKYLFISSLAMERECLVVRDYYWWPSVRRLFESQVLTGLSSRTAHQLRKMDILNCVIQSSSFQNN